MNGQVGFVPSLNLIDKFMKSPLISKINKLQALIRPDVSNQLVLLELTGDPWIFVQQLSITIQLFLKETLD